MLDIIRKELEAREGSESVRMSNWGNYEDKVYHGNEIDSEITISQHPAYLVKMTDLSERLNASTVDRSIIQPSRKR